MVALSQVIVYKTALALPPLGLTLIDSAPSASAKLEIIGDSAYLSVLSGVWIIGSPGSPEFISLSHPGLGAPSVVRRVVNGPGNALYAGATFGPSLNSTGASLFNLGAPDTPIVSWPAGADLRGVSADLRGLGNCRFCDDYINAAEFLPDGSVNLLPVPSGSGSTGVGWSSPSGFALGEAEIPGTIGTAIALWTPENEFSFVESIGGIASSIRDRLDQQALNIGIGNESVAEVIFGNSPRLQVKDQNGDEIIADNLIVSQSDFVVINATLYEPTDFFGYYPGLLSGFNDRALPLFDIFPSLSAVNFDVVTDVAAIDGYVYMTLSGSDGLYLFGARDPSMIPEPSTLIILLLGCMATLITSRQNCPPASSNLRTNIAMIPT